MKISPILEFDDVIASQGDCVGLKIGSQNKDASYRKEQLARGVTNLKLDSGASLGL